MALLLMTAGGDELFAQQLSPSGRESSPYDPRTYPQNDPNDGQYAPEQQSGQAEAPVQPLGEMQLERLVAPIALYPDRLLAQVLAASTYPTQVEEANRWRRAQGGGSPGQIVEGAGAQNWDPSVKALTAFPQVLAQMERNLQWTTDLGNAYYNQPQDVFEAVQVMRHRAHAAGNLQSTPQQVVTFDQNNIEVAPENPLLVYVPAYNPWAVYGESVSPYPGFSLLDAVGSFLGSSPISFGLGVAMTAFSNAPWGWLAWGLNWLAQSVVFNHSNYGSHSSTVSNWGFRHGGARTLANRGGRGPLATGAIRPPNSFRTFGVAYNPARGRQFVPKPPGNYGRSSGGYAMARPHAFIPRPASSYGGGNGGYSARGARASIPRPPIGYRRLNAGYNPARGRDALRTQTSRPQRYARADYGSRSSSRGGLSDSGLRSSTSDFQRSYFGDRSSRAFSSPGARGGSHGFHLFGGGHESKGFSRNSFSGGHSGGGSHWGHRSVHGGGRHHH